jgi:hypothetical protein
VVVDDSGNRVFVREIADGVFTAGVLRDVAARKLIRIDIPDQRTQGIEMLASRLCLIVFFDEGD